MLGGTGGFVNADSEEPMRTYDQAPFGFGLPFEQFQGVIFDKKHTPKCTYSPAKGFGKRKGKVVKMADLVSEACDTVDGCEIHFAPPTNHG